MEFFENRRIKKTRELQRFSTMYSQNVAAMGRGSIYSEDKEGRAQAFSRL